jgi:SnoaL-like domain
MSIESALGQLLDKQEIYEVLVRYCRAVDRLDEQLMRSLYHPGAMTDHLGYECPVEEFIPRMIEILRTSYKTSSLRLSNHLVELDGDVARSEAYIISYHRVERDGKDYDWLWSGRYIDRFERRDGIWKIANRLLVHDWNTYIPTQEERIGSGSRPDLEVAVPERAVGRRSREDPSYRR